jgi:hypothetical protein
MFLKRQAVVPCQLNVMVGPSHGTGPHNKHVAAPPHLNVVVAPCDDA